jgi:hypothetical protein
MKTDFSINVNVSIGVTPEVVALVTSILTKQPTAAVVPAPSSEQPEAPAQAPAKRGRKAKGDAPAAPADEAPKPEAQPEPQEEAAPADEPQAEAKELTEEDVRAAMDKTRRRIEGEDYKNNTDSEGYKKYHKQLTATFKNIAALLGSDKPSTLPAEQRASFIKQCDELIVENGEITTKVPY